MRTIISATELADETATDNPPVLLDVRWQLGGPPGHPAYLRGHLPGAVWVDLETELSGEVTQDSGRHPLPDADRFTEAMRRAGVRAGGPVVVYDGGGTSWGAARAWWLLRWAGHEDVRVLDGGLPAWRGPLESGEVVPERGDFTAAPPAVPVLDADAAAALARTGVLIDARAAERYRGEVEPVDPVGGHIPGAVSGPAADHLADDGTLRAPQALRDRFAALGADGERDIGVYCGSGVSAAHAVLALAHAGIDAALYPGSWSAWTSDPGRPVATGPEAG